jgi:hypothetical protein
MAVDMHEGRFRQRLADLPPLPPPDSRIVTAQARAIDFPAWRAVFSAQLLWGHSRGYALPSWESFYRACELAYTAPAHKDRFARCFGKDDALTRETRWRIQGWYESGMAETYLYVCLVDAIEDMQRSGIVLYDSRADWKLKADVIVLGVQGAVRVSAMAGPLVDRQAIEMRRARTEIERKHDNVTSSHIANEMLDSLLTLSISTHEDHQIIAGVRLFSIEAINKLLAEIDGAIAGASQAPFQFPSSEAERDTLYRRLTKL